jgi:hypothetical protein
MITSPCKNCENLYMPKDVCSIDCDKLKNIQLFQLSMAASPYSAVDSSDGSRYRLRLPVSTSTGF